jgi:hypothetical protein
MKDSLLRQAAYRALGFAAVIALVVGSLCAADAVTPAKSTPVFNGRNLDGWVPFAKEGPAVAAATWSVADGVIKCTGKPNGYIHTAGRYQNYRLTVEWRWVGPAPVNAQGQRRNRNSGVMVHMQGQNDIWPKSLECQLMETNAGDFFVIGGVETTELLAARAKALAAAGADEKAQKAAAANRRVAKQKPSAEKPTGEWNTYTIVCAGDTVSVSVNGVPLNRVTGVTVREGHICLQSEGAAIEFRNVKIEPLK